ncbi:MAG TPA: 2Fe-2S iron-sulfur cluster binding domain-containing protein [Streptosporangiaceae bacterium]|jgi:NAD(P)H-flavin reductase/ferredoxin
MGSTVTVLPFGETLEVGPGESVLAAILRQGRFVKYGCKHGGCSTCRAEVVQGDYALSDNTSFSLSDADRAAGLVLLCSTFVDDDELVVDVSGTMDDLSEDEYLAGQHVQEHTAVVDRISALTHDIRWLGLRLDEPADMTFAAGQYVEVAVPGSADGWRSFSMANPPGEAGRVDLIIKVLPGGAFSAVLDTAVRCGDRMRLRGPFGQFGVRLSHRPMIMVAGGSGMAPILAMLSDLAATGNRREVIFFYGARSRRDLFLVAELTDLARTHDWLRFVPALSEPAPADGAWDGETGLITEVMARHLPSTRGMEAYLCGPPPMIDAAIGLLKATGCKERHIFFDRFVPSG